MATNKLTKSQLKILLETRLDYSERVADITVADLAAMREDDLRGALLAWADDETNQLEVREGEHTTLALTQAGMTYPAALVMVSWLRTDPATARRALAARM